MNDKIKNITLTTLFVGFIFFFGAKLLFSQPQEYSMSERGRLLEQMPSLTKETLLSGDFMRDFEEFGLDQFPCRDSFRELKMFTALKVMKIYTVNDLYIWKDAVVEENRELNEEMVLDNLETLTGIYDKYIENKNPNGVYFSVIPEKNHYFSEESGRFSYDFNDFENTVKNNTSWAEYIDIEDTLTSDSFYKTDSHWSQDKLIETAKKIAEQMGVEIPDSYVTNTTEKDFYGVYADYILLPVKADRITYLTNETINSFKVKSFDEFAKDAKTFEDFFADDVVYNFDKLNSNDMYDFFLSGAVGDITVIENPNCDNGKNLIIFRDSFGSSLAPLLAQGYKKTTVIDLRGVSSMMFSNSAFVNFKDADVLFIYSPVLLEAVRPFK